MGHSFAERVLHNQAGTGVYDILYPPGYRTLTGVTATRAPFAAPLALYENHRVLLVEDNAVNQKVARAMVEKRFEKAYLQEALNRYGGNVSETARMTGINPRTLWRKMKEYAIERDRAIPQPET